MRPRSLFAMTAATLLVVPLLIAQAQTADTDSEPASSPSNVQTDIAAISLDPPASSLPASSDDPSPVTDETTADDISSNGEVLGATSGDTPSAEPVLTTPTEESSQSDATPDIDLLETESASSTASSTEPISSSAPSREVRTVFLQPSVEIGSHLQMGPVTATITLQNLTCRFCETASPSVTVKAYYTQWYDNDGTEPASTTERALEQTFSIASIAPWQSNSLEWTGEITTPGRYSFVVQVDPENLIGARDIYRTEFFVD